MKKSKIIKDNLYVCLVAAIVLVCASFIVISCGSDSTLKVTEPNRGQYAIDFGECPDGQTCLGMLESHAFHSESSKDLGDKPLTIEAWVKKDADTDAADFTGGIFGRFNDSAGIQLYVKNGEPKAALRRAEGTGENSSTAYTIRSGITDLWDTAWHHLAAVLSGTAHTHTEADTCTAAAMAETPHLDIYVDGVFANCATTNSEFASNLPDEDNPVMYVGIIRKADAIDGVGNHDDGEEDELHGAIDEARLWITERTATEISTCMSTELAFNSGTCGRDTENLFSYFRFNEGIGSATNDWAGLGNGIFEAILLGDKAYEFEDGWIEGVPSNQLTRVD